MCALVKVGQYIYIYIDVYILCECWITIIFFDRGRSGVAANFERGYFFFLARPDIKKTHSLVIEPPVFREVWSSSAAMAELLSCNG